MFTKICTICEKSFSVENIDDFSKYFFRDKKGKHLHNARCKYCCRIEKSKYFKKFPEKKNPNYVSKAYLKTCIVCDSEFMAKEKKHICCSDDCRAIKNKVRDRINKSKLVKFYAKKRAKDVQKATVRFKHYTDDEIEFIKKCLKKEKEYKLIAKKLGRTTIGVGKIARKIKNGVIK